MTNSLRRADSALDSYKPTHDVPGIGHRADSRHKSCANACKAWALPGTAGWRAIKRMGKAGQHICPACVAAADARRAGRAAA